MITTDKEMSPEAKEMMEDLIKKQARELESLYVVYQYDCCKDCQTVLLDRYPMSEKIICKCRKCEEYTHLSIVDPIQFYSPLMEETLNKDQLKNDCVIREDHPQWFLLRQYLDEA